MLAQAKTKLIIGPVHTDFAVGGNLRALITAAALALYEYEVEDLDDVDVQDVNMHEGDRSIRWEVLRSAAIATDPLWRQTFSALSVGAIEFGRFEMERIRLAMLWPQLFGELVEHLLEKFDRDEAEIHIIGNTELVREHVHTLFCGVTILFDTAAGYEERHKKHR